MTDNIFITQIAMALEKSAENFEMLEKMGIGTTISDDDILWVKAWLRKDLIEMVEQNDNDTFNIIFESGAIVAAKDNPFG